MLYYFVPLKGNGTMYPESYYEKLEEAEEILKQINSSPKEERNNSFFSNYKIESLKKHFKPGLNTEEVATIIACRMHECCLEVYQGEDLTDGLFEDDIEGE